PSTSPPSPQPPSPRSSSCPPSPHGPTSPAGPTGNYRSPSPPHRARPRTAEAHGPALPSSRPPERRLNDLRPGPHRDQPTQPTSRKPRGLSSSFGSSNGSLLAIRGAGRSLAGGTP